MHVVFLTAIPVALLAVVVALFLKQVLLRGTARETAPYVSEGFAMPESADSDALLQAAIAWILRHRTESDLQRVREGSGTARGPADGWCVGQLPLRTRFGRPARVTGSPGSTACLRRSSSPPSTTRPTTYLVRHDDTLTVTPVGEREIGKIIDAFKARLAEELDDWDLEDPEFHHALDSMAARVVELDREARGQRGLLAASGT